MRDDSFGDPITVRDLMAWREAWRADLRDAVAPLLEEIRAVNGRLRAAEIAIAVVRTQAGLLGAGSALAMSALVQWWLSR